MFYSVEATWAGCLQSSTNVKELIPEFFYLPEMFENTNDYDFGALEDGTKLGDVVLPPWATSPEEFVRIHRQVRSTLSLLHLLSSIDAFKTDFHLGYVLINLQYL